VKIVIETIPHRDHHYPGTCGDWWVDPDGTKHIVVSDMGNEDYAFLVALHELVEQRLCEKRGITEESVTDFDVAYEQRRDNGENVLDEPGDDLAAPYQNEHSIATGVERIVSAALGIKWAEYNEVVEALS
jgi:hypothetical protein